LHRHGRPMTIPGAPIPTLRPMSPVKGCPASPSTPWIYPAPLALAILFATACASGPGPGDSPPTPPPDLNAAGLAVWVADMCDRDPHTRMSCRESAMVRIAEARGIATAMDVVARLDAGDSEGHVLSHMIGIRGFRGVDAVGESFAECTPIHQSGCYHGVIQAYFGAVRQAEGHGALDTDQLDALCGPYRGPDGDRWLLFQCLHGLGHGVMLVHDNHLPHALESCDLLSAQWDREVCYGGAFMENAMTVTSPHHAHVALMTDDAAAGTAHDDHGGHAEHAEHAGHERPGHHAHGHHQHDHHQGAGAGDFPAMDVEDLQYPCSALHSRYQLACYDMQTALMLHLLDGDIAAVAAACRDAPEAILRALCHRSLGRDINAIAHGVHQESAGLCALAATEDRPSCHVGVVKNVIDVTADAASGVDYCSLVPAGPEAQACHRAIGEQTVMLMPDPAERVRFCEALGDPARHTCLEGAGQTGAAQANP